MGGSSQLSDWLDLAVAKASQLPTSQQDRIAVDIFTMMAAEGEAPPGNGALGALLDFIRSILPANDLARMVTVVCCASILFVQAPTALLRGVLPIVSEMKARSSPAPAPVEAQPQPEKSPEDRLEVEKLRHDLKQALVRAEHSERKQRLVETYYSIFESGIFVERTALKLSLSKDPSGYSSVVAKINRAVAVGPAEVASELRNLLLILEKFAANQYAVCDLRDWA